MLNANLNLKTYTYKKCADTKLKKYIIQHKKDCTSVIEVECIIITALDDPSVIWQKDNKLKITGPKTVMEKLPDGTIIYPIWWERAFYNLESEAIDQAKKDIKISLSRDPRYQDSHSFVPEFTLKCSQIKVIRI